MPYESQAKYTHYFMFFLKKGHGKKYRVPLSHTDRYFRIALWKIFFPLRSFTPF